MIASTMILTGSLIILALAGYWLRRAVIAERRLAVLQDIGSLLIEVSKERKERLNRIISLETKSMAHVGKVAVAIARGLR